MQRESGSRYSHAVAVPRRRGSRQLIGYSPKLKRRVTLSSRAAFEVWLIFEADPQVVTFCERPLLIETAEGSRLADFWLRFEDHEEFVVIEDDSQNEEVAIEGEALPLRYITRAELAAARIWVNNWEQMLPVINANVGLERKGLEDNILKFLETPQRLMDIEREYTVGDPGPVRACVFESLRKGQVAAPSLRTESLRLITPFMRPLQ